MRDYTTADVTIVVATVERPVYLQAALESLLRTTPPGTPLLVFFNGTSELTRRRVRPLLESWPGEVTIAGSESTLPIDRSHQSALDLVHTRLVNFMGDDDVVLEPRLERLVEAFNVTDPEPAAVTSFARRIAGSPSAPKIGTLKALGPLTVSDWEKWRAEGRMFELLWPGAVLRTDALRAVGFESSFSLSLDNRIFTKLAQLAPVIAVPHDGFGYRIHEGSISSGSWKAQHQHVRFVQRCLEAQRRGESEPTFAEFLAEERSAPLPTRLRRNLRGRSRRCFRRGGQLLLEGSTVAGAAFVGMSLLLWPPAFLHQLAEQAPVVLHRELRGSHESHSTLTG